MNRRPPRSTRTGTPCPSTSLFLSDIHPINILRVLKDLGAELGLDQERVNAWARHWIESGFSTLESMAAGPNAYLAGTAVTLADVCLVPQLYNARRVETDLSRYPTLLAIEARLMEIPAFQAARPRSEKRRVGKERV